MPPLEFVDIETLGFHCVAKQIAVPTLEGGAAGVEGIRALGHFVVDAGHFDSLARFQIVEGEIDGASAVMSRAVCRVSDEDTLVLGSGVPKDLGDVPGTVGVVDEQAIAEGIQLMAFAEERLGWGGRP